MQYGSCLAWKHYVMRQVLSGLGEKHARMHTFQNSGALLCLQHSQTLYYMAMPDSSFIFALRQVSFHTLTEFLLHLYYPGGNTMYLVLIMLCV